jgi:hypothetical protein
MNTIIGGSDQQNVSFTRGWPVQHRCRYNGALAPRREQAAVAQRRRRDAKRERERS